MSTWCPYVGAITDWLAVSDAEWVGTDPDE